MTNKLLKVLPEGTEPTKGSIYSAAIDLYASQDATIYPGTTHMIGLGVAICQEQLNKLSPALKEQFMLKHYLALHPRSSLRAKGFVSNTGIIDMDYPDEIKIILHYTGSDNIANYTIKKGDRIAQIMILAHDTALFNIHTKEERTGGIGSTGV